VDDVLEISSFIDKEYKNFALYTVYHRAIPSLIDGFKPVQRKAFYCMSKLSGKQKVMSLAGNMISTCFVGDTKILLADDSFITFDELYKNKNTIDLISYDLENKKFVKSKGYNVVKKYTKELISIELETGDIFKCTPNHLILTENGYIKAKDLTETDDIISV
jgi:hypothetical protein